MWIKYNPNPVWNHVEDCVQRAMSAALDISCDDASDIVHEFAKNMGLPEHSDAVWGAILRKNGFYRDQIQGRVKSPSFFLCLGAQHT